MTTHRNTWKGMERKHARDVGVERTPLSGGNSRHTRSDTLHPNLFIECKYRAKLPAELRKFYETIEFAKREGKIPIQVFKEKNMRGSWALLRWEDLLKFMSWGWKNPGKKKDAPVDWISALKKPTVIDTSGVIFDEERT